MKTIDCIHRLIVLTRGFRFRIALGSLAGVMCICASLFFIAVCKQLVDIATGRTEGNLILFMILIPLCMLCQIILSVFESRVSSLNTVSLENDIRNRLFSQLMNSTLTAKESVHTGDIINRMEGDTTTITNTLCSTLPNTIITLFQLVAAFCFLLVLQPELAWILLFIMPIAILSSKLYMKRMRELTKNIRILDSRIQTHTQEHLQHRILLRSMEYVYHSVATLKSLQCDLKSKTMQRTDFSLFSRTAVRLGFATGYAVAFLWGIIGLKNGEVTFGMMTAFLQLVAQVQRPIVDLSQQIPSFVQTLTSVERLEELNDIPQEKLAEPIQLKGKIGIKVNNVYFSYPSSNVNILKDFTYNFLPGTSTAIIGETGVGKSTLAQLILSIITPNKGNITFYNNDIEIISSINSRCNITYVPQGNSLLSGSIKENLLLNNPIATDFQIKEALHVSVADFVFSLPNGLNTIISELGSGLSEGQAQRIAIARGLLRNSPVIILDEPTSALDRDTEHILIKRISKHIKDKTLIIITHKDSLSELCDKKIKIINSQIIN